MKKVYEYVTLNINFMDELEIMLKKEGIKYKNNKFAIVYAIDDEMPNFEKLKKWSDDMKEKGNTCRDAYSVYTDEELYNANWMTMYCVNEHLEPLPTNRDKFFEEMYKKIAGCQNCNSVYMQKMPFRFTKSFSFKKYHSTRAMKVFDVFFVDDYFKECCERYDLKGFTFDPVYSGRRKDILKNTHQFHITSTLDFEADMRSYRDIKICEKCQKHMYLPFSISEPQITYYKEKDLNDCDIDVAYSKEHIGVSIAATYQQIIISNKMYRVLKDNHLDKDFRFDIIQLI